MKLAGLALLTISFAVNASAEKPKVAFYVVATPFKSVSPGTLYSYVDDATGKTVSLDLSKADAAAIVQKCFHGPINHPDFSKQDGSKLKAYLDQITNRQLVKNFGQTFKRVKFKKVANEGCPLSKDGFSGQIQRVTVTAWFPELSAVDPKTPKRTVVCDFSRSSGQVAFNLTVDQCQKAIDRFDDRYR